MMLYLGRHQLGVHLPFMVNPKDASGQTAAPDAAPVWTITRLGSGTPVSQGQMSPDWNSANPIFRYAKFLTGVTPGRYTLVVRYSVAGVRHVEPMTFEVLPGGDARGAVTSIYPYSLGSEQYLFHSTDSGSIFAGKRPRLPV